MTTDPVIRMPGRFPYGGGITDEPYRQRPWVVGQYSGFSDPRRTNERFRQIIAGGGDGLAVALDLPTQWGLDPDRSLSSGEVGRVGVSLSCLDDLDQLLDGIALDEIRQISTTANSVGPMVIALFVALARRRSIAPGSFSVRIQNDPLKEYVARGTHVLPVEPAAEFAVDAIEYCSRRLPNWVPMSISGYHMRDAGATRAQEIGFTLANGVEYLRRAERRGVSATQMARSVTWFLAASAAPIHEAAKFRAARELWATTLSDDFGVTDAEALKLSIIAYTLGGDMSAHEIANNAVRITLAALGAVMGGVQILFCSSIDEALGLPSDANALLSIRTQQVIARESGLADYVDVLQGSTAVEEITDAIAAEARAIADSVLEHGGATEAIESGWVRGQIDEQAWHEELRRRDKPRVGEDDREDRKPEDVRLFALDPNAEGERVKAFSAWRAARSREPLRARLAELRHVVADGRNPIEAMADAFTAGATIGETMRVMIDRHGVASDRQALLSADA
jgi:methylmalonyl-CoA mutase N-terminal domain/subunit